MLVGVALDGIEAIELRLVALEAAARRQTRARVTDARGAGAEEVGVEREDDVGLLDRVLRVDVVAERERLPSRALWRPSGFPLDPLRLREARQELAASARRASATRPSR